MQMNRTSSIPATFPSSTNSKSMKHLLYLVSSEIRFDNKFVLHSFLNVFTAWLWLGGDGVRWSHWSRASLLSTPTLAVLLSKANVKLTCYWILSIAASKINWDAFRMFSFPACLSWTNLFPYALLSACLSDLANCEAQTLGLPPLIHPTAPPLWVDHVVGAGLDESPLNPSRFFHFSSVRSKALYIILLETKTGPVWDN